MRKITVGQKKFLAEFLGNFSLVWFAGSVVTPFFTGVIQYSWYNISFGVFNAVWAFTAGYIISKDIKI